MGVMYPDDIMINLSGNPTETDNEDYTTFTPPISLAQFRNQTLAQTSSASSYINQQGMIVHTKEKTPDDEMDIETSTGAPLVSTLIPTPFVSYINHLGRAFDRFIKGCELEELELMTKDCVKHFNRQPHSRTLYDDGFRYSTLDVDPYKALLTDDNPEKQDQHQLLFWKPPGTGIGCSLDRIKHIFGPIDTFKLLGEPDPNHGYFKPFSFPLFYKGELPPQEYPILDDISKEEMESVPETDPEPIEGEVQPEPQEEEQVTNNATTEPVRYIELVNPLFKDIKVVECSRCGAMVREAQTTKHSTHCLSDDNKLCIICEEEKACIALVPCGHMNYCTTCSEKIETCSICRVMIEKTMRIFS